MRRSVLHLGHADRVGLARAQLGPSKASRVVARGTGRASKAGTVPVTLKAGKRVRSKLKRVRTANFTLTTEVTTKGAKAVRFTQTIRLR